MRLNPHHHFLDTGCTMSLDLSAKITGALLYRLLNPYQTTGEAARLRSGEHVGVGMDANR